MTVAPTSRFCSSTMATKGPGSATSALSLMRASTCSIGRLACEGHELGDHHSARGVAGVAQELRELARMPGLHQAQEPLGRRLGQLLEKVGALVRRDRLQESGRFVVVQLLHEGALRLAVDVDEDLGARGEVHGPEDRELLLDAQVEEDLAEVGCGDLRELRPRDVEPDRRVCRVGRQGLNVLPGDQPVVLEVERPRAEQPHPEIDEEARSRAGGSPPSRRRRRAPPSAGPRQRAG